MTKFQYNVISDITRYLSDQLRYFTQIWQVGRQLKMISEDKI